MKVNRFIQKLSKKYSFQLLILSGITIVTIYLFNFLGIKNEFSSVGYLIVTLLCGTPIIMRAYSGVRYKVIGIEFLVSIAVIGAILIEEYSEAGMVTFLFQLGNYLEARTLEKTRASIKSLSEMAPSTAIRIEEGKQVEVDVEDVNIDDLLYVKTGGKVGVDGIIVSGEGYFNEASITGEAQLAHKGKDIFIFAGTILDSGAVTMRATRVGEDTTFAKIITLVEEAQDAKSPVEKFIDRFAKWYTPFVALLAMAVGLISKDISLAITVLVLACPGALVIGAPVASVAGIGKGAREGILLKGGDIIHTFAKTDVMIFDKTGTLTEGKPGVNKVFSFIEDEMVAIELISSAEQVSNHPLSKAIIDYASERGFHDLKEALLIHEEKGMGIEVEVENHHVLIGNRKLMELHKIVVSDEQEQQIAQLKNEKASLVLASIDDQLVQIYSLSDRIKQDAQAVMSNLKKAGIKKLILLSGDHQESANHVGELVGMDESHGGLLPQDKLAYVKSLQEKGHHVAFIGDGINDSPALAGADTGIAIGNGSDIAIETSSVILVKSTLTSLLESLKIVKQTKNVTMQNIVIAIGTVVFLLIGLLAGKIHMASGMLIHELSILVVIVNAMRLLKKERKK